MVVPCPGCGVRYRVRDACGGKWGKCSLCNAAFVLPIPDPDQLLNWAESVPYGKLVRFISNNGAQGLVPSTIDRFIKIYERRRWAEEDRVRAKNAKDHNRPILLTERDRAWAAVDRREARKRQIESLRALEPARFEEFVAALFVAQGYRAIVVGGPADCGIDIEVRSDRGELWSVVQCKRYAQHCRVTSAQVMAFGGAYMLSGAKQGFLFTTGELTRHASKTAKGYAWLTVYSGSGLLKYIDSVPQLGET